MTHIHPTTDSLRATRKGHPLRLPVVFLGGLIFGFGLGLSRMVRPEVVLDFLQLEDLGLLFVMGGAALISGLAFFWGTYSGRRAPLTGLPYTRMLRPLQRHVVIGGVIFGLGWGLSGVCPGAAYASLGVGNYPILWAIGGMFLGAYLLALVEARRARPSSPTSPVTSDGSTPSLGGWKRAL